MSKYYVLERLLRTQDHLTLGWGDLRERLPEAFDEGFATVGLSEAEGFLNHDLAWEFRELRRAFETAQPLGESWARASVQALDDENVKKLAVEIVGFVHRTKCYVESTKQETKS